MKLLCPCPACGTQFRVDEKFAGRKTRCPSCAAELVVPQASAADLTAEIVTQPKAPAPAASRAAPAAGRPVAALGRAAPAAGSSAGRPVPVATPAARKVAPKAAAPVEPEEDDLLSFVSGPSAPKASAASAGLTSRKPKKKSALENPVTWIVAGIAAVVVIGGGAYLMLQGPGGGTPVATTQAKVPETSKAPSLEFELTPQEAADIAWVIIDGNRHPAPSDGPIAFANLPAGSHTVEIHRMTGGNFSFNYDPQKDPGRHIVKPDWSGISQGSVATSNGPSGGAGQAATGTGEMAQWQTDLDKAKFQASHDKKDLFVALFTTGTEDHADWCTDMKTKVFAKPEFVDFASKHFVPLLLECPKSPLEGSPMAKFAAQYHVTSFPWCCCSTIREKCSVGTTLSTPAICTAP